MAARLEVAPKLSVEELFERYRRCEDAVEKSHWQIIWLRAQRTAPSEVARVTGYNTDWIRRVVRRYNQQGPNSLGDRRAHNRGQKPLLDEMQRQELLEVLRGSAPDGGPWNGPKVARWIAERVGRRVSPQRGWICYTCDGSA